MNKTYGFTARRGMETLGFKSFMEIKNKYDKDAKALFVATDAREAAVVEKMAKGNPDITIIQFAKYIDEHWDEFTVDRLSQIEKEYDCAPIWQIIYTDRILINCDYDYTVHIAAGMFSFWEYVFEKYNVGWFYDEAMATLHSYAAYIVGKKTGTHFFSQLLLRGNQMEYTWHYLLDDPYQHNCMFNDDYMNETYSEEEIAEATRFLENFENTDQKPLYMQLEGKEPKLHLRDLLRIPFYVRQRFFNPMTQDRGSYIFYHQYDGVFEPVKEVFRYKRSKKYYRNPDLNAKFVYYALHFQPEASTIVCAPKYEKQLFFIDSLAKSLPADTVLYVKEHYSGLGTRPIQFYKELQQYPNVVLITPWADSRQLIEHSQCVATLTGTVGWEGFLLGKPVIMAGDIFYTNAPGIMHVDEIYGQYIPLMESWVKPDREAMIKYLCEYLKSARKGNTYISLESRHDDDNIVDVARSMMDYIKRNN